jgi:hypothetical protein
MTFRENMGELELVHPVYTNEVLVHLECNSCGSRYELEINDLLDIQTDGFVQCECGSSIPLPWEVRAGWLDG